MAFFAPTRRDFVSILENGGEVGCSRRPERQDNRSDRKPIFSFTGGPKALKIMTDLYLNRVISTER
jgi:hypothetical protein